MRRRATAGRRRYRAGRARRRRARCAVRRDPVHRRGPRRHPRRRPRQRRHGLAPAARRLDRRALPARAGADRPGLPARPARARRRASRRVLHASSIDVFAGLTLAIPALTALVAFAALDGLRPWPRTLASALVALPYLAAAYLAQEAFKEPIMALFVLSFALLLAKAEDWRDAVPLGVLAAGVTYVYSFPGLAWLAGVAAVWGAIELWRVRREQRGVGDGDRSWRAPLIALGVGVLALVVLIAPELDRLRDFADFRALHPDQANEGGLGNLPGQLSPLEALGIWPTSEFRLSATAEQRARGDLLRRRPLRPRRARPGDASLDSKARAGDPRGPARRRRPLPARPGARHRLHLRQGAVDHRPAGRAGHARRPAGERQAAAAHPRRRRSRSPPPPRAS